MSFLHMSSLSTSITQQPQNLTFTRSITTTSNLLFLHPKLSQLSLLHTKPPPKPTPIRMGGGPRTFPGGVSKWQWKRMQAKKAKQLLKARLCRERQIYEMRKRAEMKAAVAELEKPWEVVERAPTLFSVKADEQLKVLADRFQRAGGFDMWSENDGPQLFDSVGDELPSTRFFPKGVVHSLKPYQRVSGLDDELSVLSSDSEAENSGKMTGQRNGHKSTRRNSMRRLKMTGQRVSGLDDELSVLSSDSEAENGGKMTGQRNGHKSTRRNSMRRLKCGSVISDDGEVEGKRLTSSGDGSDMKASLAKSSMRLSSVNSGSGNGKNSSGKVMKKGNMKKSGSMDSRQSNADSLRRIESSSTSGRHGQFRRVGGSVKLKDPNAEVFDMSLQQDGSYGF